MADKYTVLKHMPDGSLRLIECPYFVLLAKDLYSTEAMLHYILAVGVDHPDHYYVEEIEHIYHAFLIWRLEHNDEVKRPD